MPVILLRNLCPSEGLCNGARLIITSVIDRRFVIAQLCSRPDSSVMIPRINLIIEETCNVPLRWRRCQFRLAQAFALTINKVQGQTLRRVSVWLENPVFSHGQLYTAASRVGNPDDIRFFIAKDNSGSLPQTSNIVYREVL